MLTGGTDLLYRNVLAAAHRRYVRLEVWSGGGVLLDTLIPASLSGDPEGGLCFYSGSVSATLGSRVSRQLSLSVPESMYPTSPSDLLAPFGNEIRAFSGVTMGDGSDYSWQVFRGKIRTVTKSSAGDCTLDCADRANDVLDVGFVSPQNSQVGNTVFAEFQRLVIGAVPDATFGASDTFFKKVEALTWEFDRGSALDEIATSVAALWYPLANGDFVLRSIPWTVPGVPVITFTDANGGTVNGFACSRSRERIFNVVTVTGERLNGDAPVYATSSDTDPGSPTFVGGNFGIKSIVERLQTPSSSGGAQSTADALLRSYVAPVEEWNLEMVPDAALELGDVCRLEVDSRQVTQVVTSIALPLDLSGNMSVSTRSLVVGLDVS
jgi:hypothetical protein